MGTVIAIVGPHHPVRRPSSHPHLGFEPWFRTLVLGRALAGGGRHPGSSRAGEGEDEDGRRRRGCQWGRGESGEEGRFRRQATGYAEEAHHVPQAVV